MMIASALPIPAAKSHASQTQTREQSENQIARLRDPLRRHLLPRLAAEDLAALRGSCRTLRDLVDDGTQDLWQAAAAPLLAAPPVAHWTPQAVQERLRQAAVARKNVVAGRALQAPAWASPQLPALSGCGRLAAWMGADGAVSLSRPDGSQPRSLPALGACDALCWAAEGDLLFAYSSEQRRAFVVDARRQAVVSSHCLVASWPHNAVAAGEEAAPLAAHVAQFSPDGRWLATLTADARLCAIDLYTDERLLGRPVAADAWRRRALAWSPDGEHLLVSRDAGPHSCPAELYRLADRLAACQPIGRLARGEFSPDSRHLSYFNGTRMVIRQLPGRAQGAPAADLADLYPEVAATAQMQSRTVRALWGEQGRWVTLVPTMTLAARQTFDTRTWRQIGADARQKGPSPRGRGADPACQPHPPAADEAPGPTLAATIGERRMVAVAPCPWPKLTHLAAVVLDGEEVLLWDSRRQRLAATIAPLGPGRLPWPGDRQPRWNPDGHTLHLRCPQHVQIVDFAARPAGALTCLSS